MAAPFLALPYANYVFSRSDVSHLAQGIFPMLVGCLVILTTQKAMIKWSSALILGTASLWVTHVFQPSWQCRIDKQCVKIDISGSDIAGDPGTARDVGLLRNLADRCAPFWLGAYALLERKSPMWEIYALFSRSQVFEQVEIERIKTAKHGFAFVLDLPLDGRDELRFRNTHPLIHQYIMDSFEPLPITSNPAYQIYKAKEDTQ